MNLHSSFKILLTGLILVIVLPACGLQKSMPPVPPTLEPTATTAPTVPGPTYTPAPLPTLPSVPTPIIIVVTATPESPTAEVVDSQPTTQAAEETLPPGSRPRAVPLENTNCRINPGNQTNIVGYFLVGMEAEIFGRNPTDEWLLIPNPHRHGEFCWVWIGRLKITGSLADVEVIHQK